MLVPLGIRIILSAELFSSPQQIGQQRLKRLPVPSRFRGEDLAQLLI
jgi:hypothetical protein